MINNAKTIKRIKRLATAKLTSVATFEFRSVEEINEYVKQLKLNYVDDVKNLERVKKVLATIDFTPILNKVEAAITKKVSPETKSKINRLKTHDEKIEYVKPNAAKLKKAFSVIDSLQLKSESINSILHLLKMDFKGDKGADASTKHLTALQNDIAKKLKEAYALLETLSNKHMPTEFTKYADAVYNKVYDEFGLGFSSINRVFYIVPYGNDDNKLLLCHYLKVNDFVDDSQHVVPHFYVMLSGLFDTETSSIDYKITCAQNFIAPGTFGRGVSVTAPKDAAIQSLIMLEHEGFSSLIDRESIPLTQKEATQINWSAPSTWINSKSVKVDHDVIQVTFTSKVNDKNINDANNHFITDIKTKLLSKDFRTVVRSKSKKINNIYTTSFIFTTPDAKKNRGLRLDSRKAEALKGLFGLSDKQSSDIIKYLNSLSVD